MLKPVPMGKVAIVGPKSQLPATIDVLHELNILHVEDYAPGEAGFDLGSPLPGGSAVSERLVRLRGLLKASQIPPPATGGPAHAARVTELERNVADAEKALADFVEQKSKLADEDKKLEDEEALLARIRNFPLPVELLSGYRSISTTQAFVPKDADLSSLRAIHPNLETLVSDEEAGRFVFVAAPRGTERAVQDALSRLGGEPAEVPASKGTPAARLAQIATARDGLKARLGEIEEQMGLLRERHALAFYSLDEALSIESEKSAAPVRFRTTANSFMVEGWVPRSDLHRLESALDNATSRRAFVAELPTDARTGHDAHHAAVHAAAQEPPVKLLNGATAAPYELLTDTYSRPRFNEIDPTLFFLVGFPFFYAFMLGDVGYGLLLLVLVWAGLFTRLFKVFGFQSTWHLNRIFLHSAAMSIVFGFLYGEFFGIEFVGPAERLSHHTGLMEPTGVWIAFETHLGPVPLPLSRFHEVKLLLYLSFVVATLHLLVGLVLGLRNGAAAHGWAAAVKHRGGWFCMMLAFGLAGIFGLPGVLKLDTLDLPGVRAAMWTAAAIAVIGVVILLIGEGAIALLEIPTVLSNLLSYSRLVAIGLSGAGIALAGNKVAQLVMGPAPTSNLLTLVAGVLILLFFHGLNLALGVMGPAIHSLRLHYVEFFTKFYEGGGEPYAPFGAKRRYTIKEVRQA